MKIFISKTKNGFNVHVDMEHSHAATHLQSHPKLLEYIKEIISNYNATENRVRFETNMGRIIGKRDLVTTDENDDVFYAKRPNRSKYTRFVHNREAEPIDYVTIELEKKSDTEYEIFTAFIGRLTPPFPYGKDDPDNNAREFWNTHALVTGNQGYLSETVIKECPW